MIIECLPKAEAIFYPWPYFFVPFLENLAIANLCSIFFTTIVNKKVNYEKLLCMSACLFILAVFIGALNVQQLYFSS